MTQTGFGKIIYQRLSELQPSQLYINREKLEALQSAMDFNQPGDLPPIPVKFLDGAWVMTDGHTRAFAVHKAGGERVPIIRDEDALDWDAYRICVDWCREAGIEQIADLEGRVISSNAYDALWIARCRRMQARLKADRS